MKPPNLTSQATKTSTLDTIKRQLLSRIREARFPEEAGQFTLTELREAGLCKYGRPRDMSESSFKLLILLFNQTDELRSKCDDLLRETEGLKDYRSPHWAKLRGEPDPLKRQEIAKLAQADEARVAQERAARKQAMDDDIIKLAQVAGQKPWQSRDQKSMPPDEPVFWHEPMTVMDYRKGTGLTRKTIQNMLHRLNAQPLAKRERKNAPARYGTETNYAVFREWLVKYQKNRDNRRAWLVVTWLKCSHEAPKELNSLVKAVLPVFESLAHHTDEANQLTDYIHKCDTIVYPPPPPAPKRYKPLVL